MNLVDESKRVAILVPTRNRVDILNECIWSLVESTWYKNYFVQVVFDGDPDGFREFNPAAFGIDVFKNLSPENNEYVATANLAYQLARTQGADLFVMWSDDTMATTSWLTRAVARYTSEFPKGRGILGFNHHWGDRLITHGMFDKKFVRACGYDGKTYFLFPGYKHFAADNEITEIAKSKRIMHYDETIKVRHPAPGKATPSEIHRLHDRSLLIKRREENFGL